MRPVMEFSIWAIVIYSFTVQPWIMNVTLKKTNFPSAHLSSFLFSFYFWPVLSPQFSYRCPLPSKALINRQVTSTLEWFYCSRKWTNHSSQTNLRCYVLWDFLFFSLTRVVNVKTMFLSTLRIFFLYFLVAFPRFALFKLYHW